MFASSPSCKKDYITKEKAEEIANLLHKAGTFSVHIGGGEPFIDFDGLCILVQALKRHGIGIDYIETNGFWAKNEDAARRKLEVLKRLGVYSVMVSVDPYHIEFVPLELPLKLCTLLDEFGFDYFIWQHKFLKRLMQLDITKTHTKEELQKVLGEDYEIETAREYGLGINGRALAFADRIYEKHPAEYFATDEKCPTITHPHHCHIDLYGNGIPSRCTGISLPAEDYLECSTDKEKYPVYARLVSGGLKELLEYAAENGFEEAAGGYPTKCALCYDVRRYLFENSQSADLGPLDFYEQMKKSVKFD